MISLHTNRFSKPPKTFGYKDAIDKIAEIIKEAPKHEVDSIYNSDTVRAELKKYFGEKCILCESIPIASSAFRIDHFRPKKFIKDIDKTAHFGYYWLSLEWTNIIQSCESCNSSKSNWFPVLGKRINAVAKEPHIIGESYRKIDTDPLKSEKRLLLHPELDTVEDHLIFNHDGTITEKNGSEMGKKSIEIFGLNRNSLVLVRKKKIDSYFKELVYILNKYEDRGADSLAMEVLKNDTYEFFRRLLQEQEPAAEYSRLGFFMFHDFEKFFVERLDAELSEHKVYLMTFYSGLLSKLNAIK